MGDYLNILRRVQTDSQTKESDYDTMDMFLCAGQGWLQKDLHGCFSLTPAGEQILAASTEMPKMHMVEDRLHTMLALTHTVQNRILQAMAKGRMSQGVAKEIGSHCKSLADTAERVAKGGE